MVVATEPGEVLLGKYRVEEVVGVGGMGSVVRARHLYLQQSVAIKILLPSLAESKSTIARFLREAQATVRLRSEHIARVMDVGTMPDGAPFMVMEYLDGFDLGEILRHHGPQASMSVVDLMLQACEGISEAHAMGIVHRDIKPSNFFITRRPDGSCLLKILDFGISKTPAELSELTSTQTVIGTPMYMAPEQMRTARSTDPRSDIWSMGVVMYQMLTGRPPFEAETYAELVLKVDTGVPAPLPGDLPPGLAAIVMRCLEKDPRNRLQDVGALAAQLVPYASDPMAAQKSAERTVRILATPQSPMPSASQGDLSLSPAARTPSSWDQSRVTQVTLGSRHLVTAGIVVLCIAAAVGGFALANMLTGSGDRLSVAPPPEPVQPKPTATAIGQTANPAAGTAATPQPPAQAPQAQAPQAQAPQAQAPQAQAPQAQAPQAQAPQAQAPQAQAVAQQSPTPQAQDSAKVDPPPTATRPPSDDKPAAAKVAGAATATKAAKPDTAKSSASTEISKPATRPPRRGTKSSGKSKAKASKASTKSSGGGSTDSLFDDRH